MTDSDTSFVISTDPDAPERGDTKNLNLVLDDARKPVKLGDGSFGTVFEAVSSSGQALALKVLHRRHGQTEDTESVVQKRFRHEITSRTSIKRALNEQGKGDWKGWLEVIGGTKTFSESPASALLRSHGYQLSNYAQVSERYSGNLKDLLEHGSALVAAGQDPQPGYGLLQASRWARRYELVAPILHSCATGLASLHLAGIVHLDVKPANIYYREVGHRNFEVVVGDLGFLDENKAAGTVVHENQNLPLGTRHYRSPEQKDFFDIADVGVKKREGRWTIEVRDPKFQDSIIEVGDTVEFSADPHRIRHTIKEIEWGKSLVRLELDSPDSGESLREDNSTQAMLYKRQGLRTDLFGFGGLMFDLLTGGRSPERFYDFLRLSDTPQTRVEDLVENYRQVSTRVSGDLSSMSAFSFFLDPVTGEYAPTELVQVILGCMLYRCQNTYHHTHRDEAFKAVIDELAKLDARTSRTEDTANALMFGQPNQRPLPEPHKAVDLRSEILLLQSGQVPVGLRWAQGVHVLLKVVDLVLGERDGYITNLMPENFLASRSGAGLKLAGFKLTAGYSLRQYETDVLSDLGHLRLGGVATDPFCPLPHASLRRRMVGSLIPQEEGGSARLAIRYQFRERCRLGDRLAPNDYVLYSAIGNVVLYRVLRTLESNLVEVEEHMSRSLTDSSTFQIPPSGPEDSTPTGIRIPVGEEFWVAYRGLTSESYYLQSLGVYLKQIFLSGGRSGVSEPGLLLQFLQNPTETSRELIEGNLQRLSKASPGERILGKIVYLYLRCVATGAEWSFLNQSDPIGALRSEIGQLQEQLEESLGFAPRALDHMPDATPPESTDLSFPLTDNDLCDCLTRLLAPRRFLGIFASS